jgi:hypothetical protein
MKDWERFRTFKERAEWVELQFMAAAAWHGYRVLKPWGDSLEYDGAVEHSGDLIRVQAKSSANRNGTGYLCYFRRSYQAREPYSTTDLTRNFPQPTGTFTPELPASRSPFSSSGLTTVATERFHRWDFHPLEYQLASLHRLFHPLLHAGLARRTVTAMFHQQRG